MDDAVDFRHDDVTGGRGRLRPGGIDDAADANRHSYERHARHGARLYVAGAGQARGSNGRVNCYTVPRFRHIQEGYMLKEFRDFVARGNVMDLAVGIIMGAAFGRIVTSLVEGVIMPPLGLLLGRTDFSGLFFVLDSAKGVPISLADAKAKGIPVIAYGQFINEIVGFLIVALAVFLLVKQVNRLKSALDRPAPRPGGFNQGVPLLRIVDTYQGVALSELHVATLGSRR